MRHETRTWKVEWLATGVLLLSAFGVPLGSTSFGGFGTHPARSVVARTASMSSRDTPDADLVSQQKVIIAADSGDDPPPVQFPPWWSGPCDDNHYPGSFPLSSWDGLKACGPGPNRGGYDSVVEFFPGAWGEYEWECVELSMRWLYLEYGVRPYSANGSGVVWNYSPRMEETWKRWPTTARACQSRGTS